MRVWELETYGALFDRTPDGRISQRNFGGHEYPRLAHVGDRTGLELIRTLQQKIVSLQQEDHRETGDYESRLKVFAELTITDILKADGAVAGAFGYWRESGRLRAVLRPGRHPGHRRHRQVVQGHQQLLGVHRRRPRPGPARRARRWSTWSSSSSTRPAWSGRRRSRASSSPSRCAATGECCATPRASGSCSTTSPTCSAASTPTPRRRPTAGTRTRRTTSARPSCCRATRSPARSTARSRRAAARRTAASSSTCPPGCRPRRSRRRLPSMHHQFKELADVDITAEPMEVGPTCHYVMGGVEVDADTAATSVPGPVRRRRGRGRHARVQPARRQQPLRPAGVRAPGRSRARRNTLRGLGTRVPPIARGRRRRGGRDRPGAVPRRRREPLHAAPASSSRR